MNTLNENITVTGLLFDSNPQAMWIYDIETLKFLAVNDAAIMSYGYSREEFLGMTLYDIRPAEDIERLHNDVLATSGYYNKSGIWRHRKKDGSLIFVEIVSHEIIFRNHPARHVLASDVTQAVLSQEALQRSESNFRGLFENNVAVMIIVDPTDGRIIEANQSAANFYGYSIDELKRLTVSDINRLGEDTLLLLSKAARSDKAYFEVSHILKNGETREVEVYSSRVIIDGKNCLHSIIHDVTDKKQFQRMLYLLNQAVEQGPTGIIITDIAGTILYVNARYSKMSGYPRDEIIGKNPRMFKSGKVKRERYEKLWNTITDGKIWRGELMNKKKNGELYWEYAVIAPVKDDNGKINYFIAVKEDVTKQKQLVAQLELAKDEAEEANRLKSSFLQNMSHELRTPLIAILGFAEILREDLEDIEFQSMAERIENAAKSLLETIKSILALSHVESKLLPINTTVIDISEIAIEKFNSFFERATSKGLDFTISLPSEKVYALLDEEMYSRVIYNLLDNAIKFTPKGSINLKIEKTQVTEENGERMQDIKISVSDTGVGIPEDKIPLIYGAFRQISEGYNRSFEGSGLGLTLAKMFVEKMGGRIEVRSRYGVGTTFEVIFRVEDTDISKTVPNGTTPLRGNGKILLVEDEVIVYDIIQKMLSSSFSVELACNAESALEMMKSQVFELILMDINLGHGMTGIDAVKHARKIPGYKDVPIIASTVYTKGGDEELFYKQGFDDVLPKPFTRQTFLGKIEKWVNA